LDFVEMSMPDPEQPDNVNMTRYETRKVHRYLAEKLEQVERGEILRLIVSVQPRVGKSELVSKKFPAWVEGRDPYKQMIIAGYGDEFVKEFGREVRETMESPFYKQVFPRTKLRRNAKAANRQQTTAGGILTFAGLGGQLTGKGADILIIDDPIKNEEDARSKATKDKIWRGFTKDALSRVMGTGGAIIVTATRWAEDDLIGRLIDPDLGYVSEKEAKKWTVVNIPAFAEENDPLGREVGELLWPERTPLAFLESFRELDPAGFAALYMGRPSPPEGDFFKRDNIREYTAQELPSNLRYYAASDHAVSLEQKRDSTCMGVVGVDENDNIYIMPDLIWAQLDAEDQVESMITLMQGHKPMAWWAEKGHISQSIGPFLRKRMVEEKVYINIIEKVPVKDKQTRAQPIQGRMSMGKVYFPKHAPWYAEAVEQLLNFPNGAHDDFVDFISWIGIGLNAYIPAQASRPRKSEEPRTGSLEWIVKSSERIRGKNAETERQERYLH